MKRLITCILFALGAVLLTGCDQTARQYAANLADLLSSMQKQAAAKLLDEQQRYRGFAQRQFHAMQEDELNNLAIDRESGEGRDTRQALLDGKIKGSEVFARLREYAEKDFTVTQEIFGSKPDAELDSIRSLHDLSMEKAKLDALHEALEGMAKKQTLFDTAGKLGGFGEQVKGNLDFHQCEDLDKKVTAAAGQVKNVQAQLAAAAADNKAAIQAQLDTAQAEQRALEAQRAATGRYQGGACTRPEEK